MMDDISKRKRPHTTVNASRDMNDNRLDIKRQKNRPLPSDMSMSMTGPAGAASTSSATSIFRLQSQGQHVNHETEQIQSKLGELHLTQLPEGDHFYSVGVSSTSTSTRENRDINTCQASSYAANKLPLETLDRLDQSESSLTCSTGPSASQLGASLIGSNTSTKRTDVNTIASIPYDEDHTKIVEDFASSDTDDKWPTAIATTHEAGTSIQSTTMEVSASRSCITDGNRNPLVAPHSTNNNMTNGTRYNSLDPIAENGLFSLSPDMNIPLNLNYTGIPLIPAFATRQIIPPQNFPVDMPRPVPYEGNIAEWDDEGFDESIESEASAIHHLIMSDIEEDFAS